jgi:hypothetical protein
MDSNTLIAALGKKFNDKTLQTIVRELKIKKIPKAKPKESEDYLESKDAGIQLGFTDGDYLEGRKVARYGKADMILTRFTVYAPDGEPGYKAFRGTLPGGVSVQDTVEQLISKLGPPTEVYEDDGVVYTRSWKTDKYWMTYSYDQHGNVTYVQLVLPAYFDRIAD